MRFKNFLIGGGSDWIIGEQVKRNDIAKFEVLLTSTHVPTLIVVQILIRKSIVKQYK